MESLKENQFKHDVLFAKDTIKTLEDTVFMYYPKKYHEILPLLHRAYDQLSLTWYKLEKFN